MFHIFKKIYIYSIDIKHCIHSYIDISWHAESIKQARPEDAVVPEKNRVPKKWLKMNYKPSKSSMESKRRWVCYIYVCIIDYRCLCHRSVLSMFRVLFFFCCDRKICGQVVFCWDRKICGQVVFLLRPKNMWSSSST